MKINPLGLRGTFFRCIPDITTAIYCGALAAAGDSRAQQEISIPPLNSVMAERKKKGRETTRAISAHDGAPPDCVLGVRTVARKAVAKKFKGQKARACELYDSGIFEATYLPGLVADGSKMTKTQLHCWVLAAAMPMVSEYSVPSVTGENPQARMLAMERIQSKKENIASAGWCTHAGLLSPKPDSELPPPEIATGLARIPRETERAPNRVRYTTNGFVIAVGFFGRPLFAQAKAVANQIGAVSVSMGDTACKAPLDAEFIRKSESSGRIGRKRKTIRC